jgi:Flp pilus assembly protein TadD
MDLDKALAPAQTGYASLLLEDGAAAKALEFAEHSLRVREAQPTAHLIAGQALGELGRHEEALAHLARALELAPDDPRLPYPVAAALANAGDLLGSLTAIARGLDLAPGHKDLLALQARVEAAMREDA